MFCLALSCLTLSRLTLSCLGAPERSPEHDIVTNRPTAASRKLAKGASAPRQIATEIRRRGTPPGLPGDSPQPTGQATARSEERRIGKEWRKQVKTRWSPTK